MFNYGKKEYFFFPVPKPAIYLQYELKKIILTASLGKYFITLLSNLSYYSAL